MTNAYDPLTTVQSLTEPLDGQSEHSLTRIIIIACFAGKDT